jgi:hypothetical protein
MIRKRVGALALTTVLLLGAGAGLSACESEDQKQIEDIQKDVKKGLDEIEDKVDEGINGPNEGGGNN